MTKDIQETKQKILKAFKNEEEIVINKCYGGFCISEAVARILKKNGVKILFKGDKYEDGSICNSFYGYLDNEKLGIVSINDYEYRADERLIKAIKEVGLDKANGNFAKLKIVKIPSNIEWEIDDYDGVERIKEKHRSWG